MYPTIFHLFIVCSFAFDDLIYVYGDGNKEMAEQGRAQYQVSMFSHIIPNNLIKHTTHHTNLNNIHVI